MSRGVVGLGVGLIAQARTGCQGALAVPVGSMVKQRVDERLVKHRRIVTPGQGELDPVFDDAPILLLRTLPDAPLALQMIDKLLEPLRPFHPLVFHDCDLRVTESATFTPPPEGRGVPRRIQTVRSSA